MTDGRRVGEGTVRARKALGATVLVVQLVLAAATRPAAAADILPYGATGWRYMQVPHADALGNTFMTPEFDDSSWPVGQGAFGTDGYCEDASTVATRWDPDTDLLLRHAFQASPSRPVTIHFGVDNDAKIYVNGVLVADVTHDFCSNLDDFSAEVPSSIIRAGANVIAVHGVDRCCITFFDVRVQVEEPSSLAYQATGWRYRQIAAGEPAGAEFTLPDFDDSSWSTGQGAFGSASYCPSGSMVHTGWTPETQLLLRHRFLATPSFPVILYFGIDNNATVFVNGVQVADVAHVDCAYPDQHRAVVPAGIVIDGYNTVAVHAVDGCCITFFDLRIDAVVPALTVAPVSWSQLKLKYR